MGNEQSGYAPDQPVDVVLSINDVRNVNLAPHETFYCVTACDHFARACAAKGRPVKFATTVRSYISLEVFGANRAEIDAAADLGQLQGRPLGTLTIPVHRLVETCGITIYYTWFLLEQSRAPPIGDTIERFDSAITGAPRQVFAPKVSLSLCPASEYDAQLVYQPEATNEQKVARYAALLLSHNQHLHLASELYKRSLAAANAAFLEQKVAKKKEKIALLKQSNEAQGAEIENLQKIVAELQNRHRTQYDSQSERYQTVQGRLEETINKLSRENHELKSRGLTDTANFEQTDRMIQKLNQDLRSVTEEANARIDKANESIKMLKGQVKQRDTEAQMIAAERDNLRHQLTQAQNALAQNSGNTGTKDMEISKLQNEVQILQEQKAALVKIVEDLYAQLDSAGVTVGNAQQAQLGSITGGGGSLGPANLNMLPSPRSLGAGRR
mmetsp:Transcript_15073/g.33194  ORF Transcript_15073/g.33194 Transcript_15073/m.33194 type:complete len:441 (-) Transcript_15073:197-1519(-)